MIDQKYQLFMKMLTTLFKKRAETDLYRLKFEDHDFLKCEEREHGVLIKIELDKIKYEKKPDDGKKLVLTLVNQEHEYQNEMKLFFIETNGDIIRYRYKKTPLIKGMRKHIKTVSTEIIANNFDFMKTMHWFSNNFSTFRHSVSIKPI